MLLTIPNRSAFYTTINYHHIKLKKLKTKLHGLSLQANYTDRATAAHRQSDCRLFADRGCHVVSMTDPYGRILGFLDRSRYFSIKYLLSCTHEAEWSPFQTHNFFLVVPGIEPGPPYL
jgi:hypothetical protein